jgi:polyisoprenoid-binding protein YceI
MGVSPGTYELGPQCGRLLIKTARTGLGAKVGHDLTIEVTRWRGRAVIDPADPAGCQVQVEADVASCEVAEGTGGVKPLTGSDRAEIKGTLTGKILRASRFPTITFVSRQVAGTPESFQLGGDLTIAGSTQPVTVRGALAAGRARGSATVTQSRWGIRPYTAFFGALRLRDDVEVEFDLGLPAVPK